MIFLPALDEEDRIAEVLSALPDRLEGVDTIVRLVVDDGSTDRTAEIAVAAGALVLRHPRNLGVGSAFHTAVEEALRQGADALVSIDADGQFEPSQIPDLLAPIVDDQADFVTGNRFGGRRRPESMPRLRYWGNLWVARILRTISGTHLGDVSCGFRAYSREALLNLNLFGAFTYTQETVLDMSFKGLRLAEVPVTVRYFQGRQSRVAPNLLSYGLRAVRIIIASIRDFQPLAFFGTLGMVLFISGLALDGWLAGFYLLNGQLTPYKMIGFAGVSLNVAGILITGLGLLADMLNRTRTFSAAARALRRMRRQPTPSP